MIARALVEPLDLTDEFVEAVFLYAPLHDVGKIGIPDRILLKSGRLDADEWEIMKSHTTKGRRMVDTHQGSTWASAPSTAMTSCATSSNCTTRPSTAAAIRMASPATTSRWRPGSSQWPTSSTP